MSDSTTLWTVTHQASLFMGFSRHEYWELTCLKSQSGGWKERMNHQKEQLEPNPRWEKDPGVPGKQHWRGEWRPCHFPGSPTIVENFSALSLKYPNMISIPPITVYPPSPWFPPALPLPCIWAVAPGSFFRCVRSTKHCCLCQ